MGRSARAAGILCEMNKLTVVFGKKEASEAPYFTHIKSVAMWVGLGCNTPTGSCLTIRMENLPGLKWLDGSRTVALKG